MRSLTAEDHPAVAVSKRVFERLMDYSCSLPSMTTHGKWWKRESPRGSGHWLLGVYGPCDEPGKVTIHWRRLVWYPWVEDAVPVNARDLPKLDPESSFH